MEPTRGPKGSEWNDVIEVLQRLGNMMVVRGHYAEGHPAIHQADEGAANGFARILVRVPEIVVALIDGEFVICERPMPDLRERLHFLATAMARHEIECIVFQQGMTSAECGALGRALGLAADEPGKVRELTQAQLQHVLLRFAEIKSNDPSKRTARDAWYLVPDIQQLLYACAQSLAREEPMERLSVQALANQIVHYCKLRTYAINQRSYTATLEDEATHASNVAFMTAAMALESGYSDPVCLDVTAAALLHDIGHLLLPDAIRGVPEPLLEESARPVFKNHTFLGASALLLAGCSPLWVGAALEHHRGVDGEGYPKLEGKTPPHELVRIIALANFFDRKRTSIGPRAEDTDAVLRRALELEERYFGAPLLRSFLRALGVFPPGTTVELSNRQPAIVTQSNGADPWRPQVKLLRGVRAGKRVELKELNVIEGRHELSIVSSIPPPLLVLKDLVAVAEPDPEAERAQADAQAEAEKAFAIEVPTSSPGRTSADIAKTELAHMGGILEDLLNLSNEALGGGMSAPPSGGVSAPAPPSTWPPAEPPPPSARAGMPSAKPPVVEPPPPPPPPPPAPVQVNTKPAPAPVQKSSKPPTRSLSPMPGPKPARSAAQVATAPPPKPVTKPPPVALPKRPPSSARVPVAAKSRVSLTSVPGLIDPHADLARMGIDHRCAFILGFIDGISTVEDILDASGQPRDTGIALLEELVKRGIIEIP
jgi:HD-GYP domain-containing protein (c-di-GMP phosphodiesterase class II)